MLGEKAYNAAALGRSTPRAGEDDGRHCAPQESLPAFFAFWKDADPDIPLLLEARKEYAALK